MHHTFGYGDKFIHTIKVPYTNIESKIKTKSLVSDPSTLMWVRQGYLISILLHNIVAQVLANSINADKRIKEIQMGYHEIKIVNLADNSTIVLRDVTCLNKIQVILKLYENTKIY